MPFEEFWEREGRERVSWFEPFSTLLEWELPYAKWYLGGKINVAYNCLDRHVEAGRGDKVAFHFEGEPVGERAPITYSQLLDEVVKAANGLQALGVGKGTPVGIYMGMGPGLPVAMLACARLGAPHTVVFGGFSAEALADRLNDMRCEILLTQDESWRRGQTVPLKKNADEALESCPGVRKVVVGQRTRADVPLTEGRDLTWSDLVEGQSADPGIVPLRADGLGRPALPPVHERHDCEAEGHRAYDRRLSRGCGHDSPLRLRPEAGDRRLLVRGGHRLGDRAQLHRLRAARATGRRASSTKARPTSPTRTAGGRSSSAMASRSCTRRRPRSAPT